MRARFRALLSVLLVALALFTVSLAPAGAYYGETEGYRSINFSADARGCYTNITVFYGKSVQVYCDLRNASGGYIIAKTNFVEYTCWSSQCTWTAYITGWEGWYSVGTWTMKKDDYGGLHAIINYAGSY